MTEPWSLSVTSLQVEWIYAGLKRATVGIRGLGDVR